MARVVSALDGVPLALELAASSLRFLSLTDLADAVENGLELSTSSRERTGRHDTVGNAMAWSLGTLDESTRDTLRAVCTVLGSFTLDDATAVCSGESEAVTRTVIELVERSLVSLQQDADGAMRYRVLAPMRRAVTSSLGPPDGEVLRRHAQHFIGLASTRGGMADRAWQTTMERISDNVTASIRYAVMDADTALAVAGAISLSSYFRRCGALERARAALAAVLPMLPRLPDDEATDVLLASAALAVECDDCEYALGQAAQARRRAADAEDSRRQAHALLVEASARTAMTEYHAAGALLDEALRLFDVAADVRGTAVTLGQLGALHRLGGASELAAGLLGQGLARLSSVRGATSGWTVTDMVTHQRGRSLLLAELGRPQHPGAMLRRRQPSSSRA
ncbi:MAG: hypothetical protein WKF82_10005 [Nocardioidaceae bacterium]